MEAKPVREVELSTEKSKKSLGELYEAEYLKKVCQPNVSDNREGTGNGGHGGNDGGDYEGDDCSDNYNQV